jgi:hypothetical protein
MQEIENLIPAAGDKKYFARSKSKNNFFGGDVGVISPWRSPLPREEYTTNQVVVYFYSGRWIPIMFCRLAEAIALHRRALLAGKELFVFPPEVNPSDSSESLP